MAKLPGWIKVMDRGVINPDGSATIVLTVKIRWWHPGLWVALWRHRRAD